MNSKKIAFITAVNDERVYQECLKYIDNLNVPTGFAIEAIGMRDGRSMTSVNNEAMEMSDAKYKIYLHQDVFIINRYFIFDILKLFEDEKIGIIGVVGAVNHTENGIWWEGKPLAGAVYDNHTGEMETTYYQQAVDKNYTEVSLVDGLCICTQYDLRWREDIFDGWHFYDSSQSVEFSRKGYKCIVPNQENPWCVHDCGIADLSGYFDTKKKFIEYLKEW